MPGSTDNTEGTASAVPSVASAEAPPLTRREARALREAQDKVAKSTKKRGSKKSRQDPPKEHGVSDAPSESQPAVTVNSSAPGTPTGPAVTPQDTSPATPAPVAQAAPAESTPKPAASDAAKARAKAAFTAPESAPLTTPRVVSEQESASPVPDGNTELPQPLAAVKQSSTPNSVLPTPQPAVLAPAQPEAPLDPKRAKDRAKAAFAADDTTPALPDGAVSAPAEVKVEGPAQQPPNSESSDLADAGQPDPAKAAVPTELLVGAPQEPAAQPKKSRAGRNLPAAIAVGVVLLGVVLVGLFWYEPLLVGVIVLLSGIGCWEVARATTHAKTSVPLIPLFLASLLLPLGAVFGGLEAVSFAYVVCLLVALLFRLMDGLKGAAASVMSSVFIISWIPLLLSFALLILAEPNGQWLIATILLLAVANDTFGYIVGVMIGKHPMAPKISPKKSWEGFAGSMVGSMAVGAAAMHFWLDMPWWTGVILAFFTTIAATTGDFSESMVKRELGIKDMSNLLPGHGGIMDRLDSILFVVPLGYLISHLLTWSVSLS